MSIDRVNDIIILKERQAGINLTWEKELSDLENIHPDVDIKDIIPTVLTRFIEDRCIIDDSPMVGVESISLGKIIPLCRNILSAIKQKSLTHLNPDIICYRCKIIRNANGVVAGALHYELRESNMLDFIIAGKVSLDSDSNTVIIDD